MRVGMVVEYDGGGFCGSQYQAEVRTVQGELERASKRIFRSRSSRFRLASRTDAGVHAIGQVAAFDVESDMAVEEMQRAMNGNLLPDLRVRRLKRVNDEFDPRRDAAFREYMYVINDSEVSSPISRRNEHHVRGRLSVDAMNVASRLFGGVHDFASFAAADAGRGSSTIRNVYSADAIRHEDGRVVFKIRANAFVRQQIRRMAALLIDVGRGTRQVADVEKFLVDPRRGVVSQTAPAKGLTLTKIGYGASGGCTALPSKFDE